MSQDLSCQFIKGTTIDDIHFKLIRRLFQRGNVYVIDRGSWEGHKRLEFDYATFQITVPGTRPLAPQLPPGLPPVTDEESINQYFVKYIMNDEVNPNEIYTYGEFVTKQVPDIIKMFKEKGYGTNHAVIAIGNEESIKQEHPPCLRIVQFFVARGMLHMSVYFRSWDLWGGLPENLGGLQLLKEYVAQEINAVDGEIFASSPGLHLYDMQWPVALARLNGVMPEESVITQEEAELGEGWMNQEVKD
jgi:thymidylate synthase